MSQQPQAIRYQLSALCVLFLPTLLVSFVDDFQTFQG
jgi:hypothetical protein